LGGRAAEEIVFNQISTGASNDLERVTEIATRMVTTYGMSEKLGHMSFTEHHEDNFLGGMNMKPYSEDTARIIDAEVKAIIDRAYLKTRELLLQKRDRLEALAAKLLELEVLDKKQIEEILGEKPVAEINNGNGHLKKVIPDEVSPT